MTGLPANPHARGLVLRLAMIVGAVVMAVALQSVAGDAGARPPAHPKPEPPCESAEPTALRHPALAGLQPVAARSRDASSGCSRAAAASSYRPLASSR